MSTCNNDTLNIKAVIYRNTGYWETHNVMRDKQDANTEMSLALL